ncbi:hypothetical protein BEL04_15820 [Mucilaginibacter sp. PPCGB 2223]|uniref:hypothetical protein n=1 Tax=Mucilaginibacter sp. PPCGB 2223 TaxID=1886027 RepID=UPI0008248861|nr:hypothetical protein [Mucilaginibacter sp. PPCGB 2223]OCX51491.1 hypothetical protein BEL04_15820 [Mucilaginibacter sp. PPCGB 2223]
MVQQLPYSAQTITTGMRNLLLFSFIVLALASCKKQVYDIDGPNTRDTTSTTATHTETGSNNQQQAPAAGQFTGANAVMPDQHLSISLTGATLNIVYNEDVVLLTQTESLRKSYAVHFKEDFSASYLKNMDFHSMTAGGVNAYNWVDDNLNNINKTMKDTVINHVAVTKIEIVRSFNFEHTFDSAEAALAQYNLLLADKTQSISFSAYYDPTNPGTITIVGKSGIVYEGK